MKRKINIIFSWLLVVCVITMIFYFSSQNATKSENVSNTIIDGTIGGINNGQVLDKLEQKYTRDLLSVFIRNLGHLFEYAVLGFFMYNAVFITFKKKKNFTFIICIISFIFIGSLDEFIQSFSDRNGNFIDVCIDTAGGIIGSVGMMIFYYFIKLVKDAFYKNNKIKLIIYK